MKLSTFIILFILITDFKFPPLLTWRDYKRPIHKILDYIDKIFQILLRVIFTVLTLELTLRLSFDDQGSGPKFPTLINNISNTRNTKDCNILNIVFLIKISVNIKECGRYFYSTVKEKHNCSNSCYILYLIIL